MIKVFDYKIEKFHYWDSLKKEKGYYADIVSGEIYNITGEQIGFTDKMMCKRIEFPDYTRGYHLVRSNGRTKLRRYKVSFYMKDLIAYEAGLFDKIPGNKIENYSVIFKNDNPLDTCFINLKVINKKKNFQRIALINKSGNYFKKKEGSKC